jgi:metal-responsive CopG/Arc/MetJ family transcriptional regulator
MKRKRRRLTVSLEEAEFREIQNAARRHRLTVSDWVRQILRATCRKKSRKNRARKLQAIHTAVTYSFPTTDIDEMLGQIEFGYLDQTPR